MSHEVEPSRQSGSNAFINSQTTRYGANESDWIQPAGTTLLADESPQIADTNLPLQGFDESHTNTSLDVTIDTGEGFVGGAYIATDQTHTVTLQASTTDQEVYVGWDYNATNTVQVGLSSTFEAKDPKLLAWTFNTDSGGVTKAVDNRPLGFTQSQGGTATPSTGVRIVGPDAGHFDQIQEAIDSRPEDHGEIYIHPDWEGASTESWPVRMGTETIRGAGPRASGIVLNDHTATAFISNPDSEGGKSGCSFRELRIAHADTAIVIEGQFNARIDNVTINNCHRGIVTQHGGGTLRPDSFSHLITNVRVRGYGYGDREAFKFNSDGHSVVMVNCEAIDHRVGIDVYDSAGFTALGCSMQLNDHYGGYFQGCRALNVIGCYVESNGGTMTGDDGAGILLDNVEGGLISGCYFNGGNVQGFGVNTNTYRGAERVTIENCTYINLVSGFININAGADIPSKDIDVMLGTHTPLDDTPFWNLGNRGDGDKGTRTRSNGVLLKGKLNTTRGQFDGDLMIADGQDTGVGDGDLAIWKGSAVQWVVFTGDTTITP